MYLGLILINFNIVKELIAKYNNWIYNDIMDYFVLTEQRRDYNLSKNSFLKQYLELPDKSAMRYMIISTMILVNIFDFMILSLTEINLTNFSFSNYKFLLYLLFVIAFDIWALCIFIYVEKFSKYFYLLTAIAFTSTSIFYFFEANRLMFLDFGLKSIIYSLISIIIYILLIITVIFNISSKIKNKHSVLINTKNTSIIAFIGAAIGVFLPKPTSLNRSHLPLVAVLLLLSYLLIFTSSGFHKFYLGNKMDRLQNRVKK